MSPKGDETGRMGTIHTTPILQSLLQKEVIFVDRKTYSMKELMEAFLESDGYYVAVEESDRIRSANLVHGISCDTVKCQKITPHNFFDILYEIGNWLR